MATPTPATPGITPVPLTKTVVSPTVPPTHDHDYHPAHPGNLGTLIHALHMRLVALEIELGLRDALAVPTPVVQTPPPNTTTPAVPMGAPPSISAA